MAQSQSTLEVSSLSSFYRSSVQEQQLRLFFKQLHCQKLNRILLLNKKRYNSFSLQLVVRLKNITFNLQLTNTLPEKRVFFGRKKNLMLSLLFEFSYLLDKCRFRKNSRGCILVQPRHSGSNFHDLAVQWVEMMHIQIIVNYTNVCCTNHCLICAMFSAFTALYFLVLCQRPIIKIYCTGGEQKQVYNVLKLSVSKINFKLTLLA